MALRSTRKVGYETGDEQKASASTTPLEVDPVTEAIRNWYSSKDIVEVDGVKSSSSSGLAGIEGTEA